MHRLRPAWIYQPETGEPIKSSPLVLDGVMLVTEPPQTVAALDPLTGRVLWQHRHKVPEGHRVYLPNRGVAVGDGMVFFGTHDARLLALNANTGDVRWNQLVADYHDGSSIPMAPLVVKDKVLVGISGGAAGIRGFLDAYSIKDGSRAWRFWTVPSPGEPGHETWSGDSWKTGGASIWMTGTFDPELNLVYWGTGNPVPAVNGGKRHGDNLYSSSLIALDADTGRLKWHFQFTPHDVWDFDASHVPVLVDRVVHGRMRKLVLMANKNAFYYVLDRETGELLSATQFSPQTWTDGLDAKGRPRVRASAVPTTQWTPVRPSMYGATNWHSPAYSPSTGLFYFTVRDAGGVNRIRDEAPIRGQHYWGGTATFDRDGTTSMKVKALRAETGQAVWEFPLRSTVQSGLMATAGGLVFGGTGEGNLFALDADTGKPLWNFQSGGPINGNPVTYATRGLQYVVTPAGKTLVSFSLPEPPSRQ